MLISFRLISYAMDQTRPDSLNRDNIMSDFLFYLFFKEKKKIKYYVIVFFMTRSKINSTYGELERTSEWRVRPPP